MHASRYGTNIRYISEGPSRNICRAWFARFATRKKSLFPGWRGRFMRVFEKYRLTIRQSFESSLRFSNETISTSSNSLARSLARPPRQLGMSYSPWTSGKLYLREAVITNPVEIVRKLETWNNFTAFKPGSTLCGANRCDDNSLILENSHSTGRGNYFSFIHPSLSRQTLSKATVSISLSISPFLSLCPVAFDYSRESSRAKRNRQRYRFVFRDFDLEGNSPWREKRERERLNTGKNKRWNFTKEISQGRQEIEIERYPGNWNGPTATAPNLCVTILFPLGKFNL